jgi:hypothetical protein
VLRYLRRTKCSSWYILGTSFFLKRTTSSVYRETCWLEPQDWRGCSSLISLALFIKAFRIAMTIVQSIRDKGSPCCTPCHGSVWRWINLPGTPFAKASCGGSQKIEGPIYSSTPWKFETLFQIFNWSNLPLNKIFLFFCSLSLSVYKLSLKLNLVRW